MIAPIRPAGRTSRPRTERSGVRKARRWVARSFLDPERSLPPSEGVASRGVWAAVGWMLAVAGFYGWHLLRARFELF